jgi:hypothetical protein
MFAVSAKAWVFENRQPLTAAKFITKTSLFILVLGVIRLLKLKLRFANS